MGIDRIAKVSHGHRIIVIQLTHALSGGHKCVKALDMAGGRKIIAIEGGMDDDATQAAAVRLGKRLAGEALVEDADGGAALMAASEDTADGGWPVAPTPEDSMAVWDDDEGEAVKLEREWLGLAVSGALIAAWTGAFITGNLAMFRQAKPLGVLTNPPEENQLRPRHLMRVIRPGKASGPLTGGNLSLIASLMGTRWEIRTEGKLLF
ncbi:MAG: hypothetical protein K2Q27_00650, partial [Novosphingobium sp.]|nr:hypothetical protein [Novosphingobium sp.]